MSLELSLMKQKLRKLKRKDLNKSAPDEDKPFEGKIYGYDF